MPEDVQLQRLLYPRAQLCWKRSRGLAKLQDGMTGPTSGAHKSRPSWHHSPCSITGSLVIQAMWMFFGSRLWRGFPPAGGASPLLNSELITILQTHREFCGAKLATIQIWSKTADVYCLLFVDTCGPVTAWQNDGQQKT